MGGIVVYIDTENATSIQNLKTLGVDISKRFVYVDTHCTEEVLSIAEKTILKAKALDKDVPVTIIWDSVAATSPKAMGASAASSKPKIASRLGIGCS